MFIFRKIWCTFLVTSVLRFALLSYYRRFNPFWVSISFLYRLKTENYRSFLMFSGSVEIERPPEIREKDILTITNKRAKQICRILCWLILGDDNIVLLAALVLRVCCQSFLRKSYLDYCLDFCSHKVIFMLRKVFVVITDNSGM